MTKSVWYLTKELEPVGEDPWAHTAVGETNAFFYAKLSKYRTGDPKSYMDLLCVFVDEYDKTRRGHHEFSSLWLEDGKVFTVTTVRGELILSAVRFIQLLLESEDPKHYELATRLVLWVVCPQEEMWLAKGQLPRSCSSGKQLLALCLLRLQVTMIIRWEQQQKNPVSLTAWASWIAEELVKKLPHLQPVATEMRALTYLYADAKSPSDRVALLQAANKLFERLGHRERVVAIPEMTTPSKDLNQCVRDAHLKPVCAMVNHNPLAKDYIPEERESLQKLWRQRS